MLRLLFFLLLCTCVSPALAVEDLRGNPYLVNSADVTFYGRITDVNDLTSIGFPVQICWDDPALKNNCDQPVIANTTTFPQTTCTGTGCTGFHYPIPSGVVGNVTPRDGNQHLMYIKVISKVNPGAGDKQIDGSPWPFVFRNGVVGPMWTANLETTPSRLSAAQLAILVNSQDLYSTGSTGNVVCTVSGVSIRDDGAAGYYAQRRGVPCTNISVISVPVVQTTTQTTFNASILPTVQALPASIQAVALAWVQPSTVGYTSGGYSAQSISATVANAGLVLGTGCVDGSAFLGQGPINPYFNSSSQAPYTDHRIRPTMMLVGETCPSCTSTNNYSSQWYADFLAFKSVVDAAILGMDTNPSGGNVYWSLTGDLKRSQTTVAVSPLELGAGLSPYVNAQILGTRAAPAPITVSAQNILMYEESAANWNYSAPTFVPGAGIGYAVTSTSGWLPSDGNQTTAASWLSQGAIGAYGNAAEPCELLAYKHLDPALVIPNYTQGQTLVESLWKSVRLPWGGNFLGDPLAAPFTLQGGTANPAPSLTALSPSSAVQGSTTNVTFTGRNFTSPATVTIQNVGVTASNITVSSPTSLNATFTVSSTAAPGSYNVTVSTASGVSTSLPFQVTAPGPTAPVLSSVSPASVVAGSSAGFVLTGTGFVSGSTLTFSNPGVTASNVAVASASQISATVNVAAATPSGNYTVQVTGSTGTSNAVAFTVTAPAPTLSSLSPSSASPGTAVQVTLTGSNFTSGTTVSAGATAITVTNVVVASASQINATFTIDPSATPQTTSISVSTGAAASNAVAFTINGVQGAPVLSGISPASTTAGFQVNVVLAGTGFTSGTSVIFNTAAITASKVSVVSSTQVNALLTVLASIPPGAYTVAVKTPSATSNNQPFTVAPAKYAPTLASISPNSGTRGTSVSVVLAGTNFTSSTSVRLGGSGASAANLVVVSPTQINVTFVLSPTMQTGTLNVYVSNAGGSSSILPFTVN